MAEYLQADKKQEIFAKYGKSPHGAREEEQEGRCHTPFPPSPRR